MKTVLTFLCLTFLGVFATRAAHQGSISGNVTAIATGETLPEAYIAIDSTIHLVSNALGAFAYSELEAGEHTIQVSYLGYKTAEQKVMVRANETTVVDFLLEEQAFKLEAAEVAFKRDPNLARLAKIDQFLRPTQSAQELLTHVPGLFIAQHGGGGKAEQLFLRGFDIDHGTDVNIEVDGLPVNMVSHAHGQGYADLHFVIPELIDEVTYSKGPYQASKGNFATAGSVELNTLNQLQSSSFKLERGAFNTSRYLGLFDLVHPKASNQNTSAFIGAELLTSDGPFENSQDFSRINFFSKYHTQIGKSKLLTASFSAFTSDWSASGQIPQRAVDQGLISRFGAIDPTEGGETSRVNASLKFIQYGNRHNSFSSQLYYTDYRFDLISNFTFFLEDSINGDQIRQQEKRQLYGYKGVYEQTFFLNGLSINSTAGVTLRQDENPNVTLNRTANRHTVLETLSSGDVSETNAAVYLNEQFNFGEKLIVQLGARYDYFDFTYTDFVAPEFPTNNTSTGLFSPKAQVHYQATKGIQVFAKVGQGFHSNDTRTVTQNPGQQIVPAARGIDLGLHLTPTKRLWTDIAVWGLNIDQEFVFVGDAGIVELGGKTQRVGVDASVRYQPLPKLVVDVDVNLSRPRALEVPSEESFIPLAPLVTSSGGITWVNQTGFSGSLRYRFIGDRPANETNTLTAPGYQVVDANVKYARKRFTVGLSAFNLFDVEWNEAQFETESRLANETAPVTEIHFTPGAPFHLRASLEVRF